MVISYRYAEKDPHLVSREESTMSRPFCRYSRNKQSCVSLDSGSVNAVSRGDGPTHVNGASVMFPWRCGRPAETTDAPGVRPAY